MRDFDVVIVGGGPSGATSALKCSQLGFNTLLVEKGTPTRHKPCGGVLPTVCVDILDDLGLKIPPSVKSTPATIGLFYVPPTGRRDGGHLRDYRLLNVNRDRFDDWLRKAAEGSGATVLYEAEFVEFKRNRDIEILIHVRGDAIHLSTRYLIGADGLFSPVKRELYPNEAVDFVLVVQERWIAEGDFGEYFYAFFKGDITPAYSYVIPKSESLVVGTGVPRAHTTPASDCMDRFKDWLRGEFAFEALQLEAREAAAIPYGLARCGEGNIILVGDAAGFCNHFSGEGVRLAIESGIASAEAVAQAESDGETLYSSYSLGIRSLVEFVHRTHEFTIGMTDDRRQRFVRSELCRASFDLL